jgi:hypothetical protein
MRCAFCNKIHHELPNTLVPYKRYDRESIESMITESKPAVASDESTLKRVRTWFLSWLVYAVAALSAIERRKNFPAGELSNPLHSSLLKCGQVMNGWLANAVRALVNLNLWVHTRSACLSEPIHSTIHINPINRRR